MRYRHLQEASPRLAVPYPADNFFDDAVDIRRQIERHVQEILERPEQKREESPLRVEKQWQAVKYAYQSV